jgi:GTP-binding protein HflX
MEYDEYDKIRRVFVSAQTGEGIDLLRQAIAGFAQAGGASLGHFPPDDSRLSERSDEIIP